MKKFISLILALGMLLSLASCSSSPANEVSLYDKGLKLIADMDKMAESEDYLAMMSSNPEMKTIIDEIAAGDYSLPKKVIVLKNLDTAIMNVLTGGEKIDESIEKIVKAKLAPVLPSQINALHGVMNLASANVLTHGSSFLNSETAEPLTYIYLYEGKNTFMVSFIPSEDGIMNASANVVISEDVASCDTVEKMASFMVEGLGLEGLVIEELAI